MKEQKLRKCMTCKKMSLHTFKAANTKDPDKGFMCRECNTAKCRRNRHTARGVITSRNRAKRTAVKNRVKQNARVILNYHVKVGHITKPKICSICLSKTTIYAHHNDYDFPLIVEWLCSSCHAERHNDK